MEKIESSAAMDARAVAHARTSAATFYAVIFYAISIYECNEWKRVAHYTIRSLNQAVAY